MFIYAEEIDDLDIRLAALTIKDSTLIYNSLETN